MLDRGEQLGWFTSPEIVAELIVSIVGFYYFFAHSLTTPEPFVRFAIFRDRNFLIACFFMVIMGLMLFSSMALATPFIQNMLGYPITTAGWVLASRGIGTLVGMLMIGRLLAPRRGALPDPDRADADRGDALPDDRLHAEHRRSTRS